VTLGEFCANRIGQTLAVFLRELAICRSEAAIPARLLGLIIGPAPKTHSRHRGVFQTPVGPKKKAEALEPHGSFIRCPCPRMETLHLSRAVLFIRAQSPVESPPLILRLRGGCAAWAPPRASRAGNRHFSRGERKKHFLDSEGRACGAHGFANQAIPALVEAGGTDAPFILVRVTKRQVPCAKQSEMDQPHDFYAATKPVDFGGNQDRLQEPGKRSGFTGVFS